MLPGRPLNKNTFEQSPRAYIWGKTVSGGENSECKGLEATQEKWVEPGFAHSLMHSFIQQVSVPALGSALFQLQDWNLV